jgi:RimJ/RimL family protein N-acetyltransferase
MAEFALATDRLILRGWRDEDHAPLLAICRDPRVMGHLGPLQTAGEIHAAIDRQRTSQGLHGHCFWAIERREDGAMLGFCGLKHGPHDTPIEDRIEIGWRLRADAWGRGYAREAAQASLDWGWGHLADGAIWAITTPGNLRSWGLMERLGMRRRHDLDFDHPAQPAESPLLAHVTYGIYRPGGRA